MGTFKSKEDYLKQLCIVHPVVAHGSVVNGITRNSFFRMNNDEEILAATIANISYPAVGYYSLRGRIKDTESAMVNIFHLFSNAWIFVQHVSMITVTDGFTDAIEECYDETFGIMEDFIRMMKDDYEANGHCGAFEVIDLNKMNYEMVGPVYENEYGWILYFDDERKANRIITGDDDTGNYWQLEGSNDYWELE